MKVEKCMRMESQSGLNWELSVLIARRLSCLDAVVGFYGQPDENGRRHGWKWPCERPASFRDQYGLSQLDIKHGDSVKVIAEGPKAELAVEEIAHLLAHPDLETNAYDGSCKPCLYAEKGPRGRWTNISGHLFGNFAAESYFNREFYR